MTERRVEETIKQYTELVSIARTIADFHEEKYVSFQHQELAREIFWRFVAPLEESVDYLREEVKYLSDPDS